MNNNQAMNNTETPDTIVIERSITKQGFFTVSMVDSSTGVFFGKDYFCANHGRAAALAAKMLHDRGLFDIVDVSHYRPETEPAAEEPEAIEA